LTFTLHGDTLYFMKNKFSDFGREISYYRKIKGVSIKDTAGAIGIDRTYLSRIENGHEKPSKELFWKIVNFFDLTDDRNVVMNLANQIGLIPEVAYGRREVQTDMKDQMKPETGIQELKEVKVTVDPAKSAVLYTDSVFVTRSQYGLVFDFAQAMGSSNEHMIVSRIGMSEEHAKALLKVLESKLKESIKSKAN